MDAGTVPVFVGVRTEAGILETQHTPVSWLLCTSCSTLKFEVLLPTHEVLWGMCIALVQLLQRRINMS